MRKFMSNYYFEFCSKNSTVIPDAFCHGYLQSQIDTGIKKKMTFVTQFEFP